MLLVEVHYMFADKENRDGFIQALADIQMHEKTRQEAGNIMYDYFVPLANDKEVLLLEKWEKEVAPDHFETAHMAALREAKAKYVIDHTITNTQIP